jgi:hypothetical protein
MEYKTSVVLLHLIDQKKIKINDKYYIIFTQSNERKIEYLLSIILISIVNLNDLVFVFSLSILPSSRLKLVLIQFFLTSIFSYNFFSKIDFGVVNLEKKRPFDSMHDPSSFIKMTPASDIYQCNR